MYVPRITVELVVDDSTFGGELDSTTEIFGHKVLPVVSSENSDRSRLSALQSEIKYVYYVLAAACARRWNFRYALLSTCRSPPKKKKKKNDFFCLFFFFSP
jgi:hypothetical protein